MIDFINPYDNGVPLEGGKDGLPLSAYKQFGQYASTAKEQGWFPETEPDANGTVVYKSGYGKAFNNVVIPDSPNELGDVALVGHNNNRFDVVIRDKQGNIRHTMFKGIYPADVNAYLTKAGGVVDDRISVNDRKSGAGMTVSTQDLPIGTMP